MAAKTAEPNKEVELLKSLEVDFSDDELVGAKINQRLANIASRRWGITLPNDKLKALLAKQRKIAPTLPQFESAQKSGIKRMILGAKPT